MRWIPGVRQAHSPMRPAGWGLAHDSRTQTGHVAPRRPHHGLSSQVAQVPLLMLIRVESGLCVKGQPERLYF